MSGSKDGDAQVSFRGVNPFGETTETHKVGSGETTAEDLDRLRSRKVRDVVLMLTPMLETLRRDAPDRELSPVVARRLRSSVAAAVKEALGKIKK